MPEHSEPKLMAPPKQFLTEILWNFLYRIKRDAPPAPPRIPQKFHNFLDFYTAPPKFTHAPSKFTHFRSMTSGDILILVKWNLKFEILWFRISSFIWMSHILFSFTCVAFLCLAGVPHFLCGTNILSLPDGGSTGSWESLVGQRSCQANRWGGH